MREFAEQFYKSKAWKQCRERYAKSVSGLCENCLEQGRITPGEIVHHKVHLSPMNIDNPEVTLNWDNLELLCRDCHARRHSSRERRYEVDSFGRVTTV